MFAFAIFDPRKNGIWLARDRVGVKPLYYHFSKQLRFASSMSGLFAFPEIDRMVDDVALIHYLRTIRTTLGKRTLIKDVFTLEPGQQLWWQRNEPIPTISTYWDLPQTPESEKASCDFAFAVDKTRELVDAAVSSQLISDVPLGGFLSGGLDSSVVTAAAIKGGSNDYGTFSVGYEKQGFNEWSYVREAASYYRVSNHEIQLSPDSYVEDWEWLVAEKGLPLSTPNEIPILHLARAFSSRFKAALTGEGADEVFGGYVGPTFCATDYDRSVASVSSVDDEAIYRWYGKRSFESRQQHFFEVNSWLREKRISELMAKDLGPSEAQEEVNAYYRDQFSNLEGYSTFDTYLRIHFKVNLEGLLNRLDSSTMAASVEGRVPFTDHRLVEFLFSLPDSFKMDLIASESWGSLHSKNSFEINSDGLIESKRLLRTAYKDRVSESIRLREKMSFPVPFADWFSSILLEPFRQRITESSGVRDILDSGILLSLLEAPNPDPMVAWPLMNLAIWQRQFGVRF